ncbi:hypothetical protein A5638_20265 [Mycolicibacterium fortuitum]|nr:hypothetical protein A5638_20265 [Mycolicibacterium fortuitum]
MPRRYGAELDEAIRAAVRTELTAHGYSRLTFEGVAAEAKTAKTVLYRRWPTKALMVLDTFEVTEPLAVTPDTGSLPGDLRALLCATRDRFPDRDRTTILGLMADLGSDGAHIVHQLLLKSATDLLDPLLDRARARGELGTADIPARALRMPFDLMRHDALIETHIGDDDINSMINDCIVPLYAALSHNAK